MKLLLLLLLFLFTYQGFDHVYNNLDKYKVLSEQLKKNPYPRPRKVLFSNNEYSFKNPAKEHIKLAMEYQTRLYNLDPTIANLTCPDYNFDHYHIEYDATGAPKMVNGQPLKTRLAFNSREELRAFATGVFPLAIQVCYYEKEKLEFHAEKKYHGVRGYQEFTPKDENVMVRMGNGKSTNVVIFAPAIGSIEYESNNYEFTFRRLASGELCIDKVFAYDRVFQASAAVKAQVYAETDPKKQCKIIFDYFDATKNATFADTEKFTGY